MSKKISFLFVCLIAFAIGYSVNNIAKSDTTTDYKVAIVDIQRIVANSGEISRLKATQEKKVNEMQVTIEKARAEIAKETDPAKIAELEEKYRNEINNQKIALDTDYNNKINEIDANIKAIVIEKARSMNYNVVLPKSVVLFGGDDITDVVAKDIK